MDLEGEMVQKNSFVSFEQKPIFNLPDYLLLVFSFLVFLGYRFVDILLFGFICISRLHNRYLLLLGGVGHLHLLYNLLVLEVYRIHLGAHLEFVLG